MAMISSAQLWRKNTHTHTRVEAADGTAQVHCTDRAPAWADTAGLQTQQLLSCSLWNVPTLCPSQCFSALRPTYLANVLLVGHEVMESEVHHVRARHNGQSFQQKGAVRVIQVKDLAELLALQHKQNKWGEKENEQTAPGNNKKRQDPTQTWTQAFQQLQNYGMWSFSSFLIFHFLSVACITKILQERNHCDQHHRTNGPLWSEKVHVGDYY